MFSPPFFFFVFLNFFLFFFHSTPFILILFPIYSQEVTQDIDDETRRMNEFKKKKKSTDNVAIDRLTSLLRTGQKETPLQKLAKETEQSRTQLLGQEDARTLLDQENDDDDDSNELMSRALSDLGGGDESMMEDKEEEGGGPPGLLAKTRDIRKLRSLIAKRMGGTARMREATDARKKHETMSHVENDVSRQNILKEMTHLKESREHLLQKAESQGIETTQGQQTASQLIRVDSEILSQSQYLGQLQETAKAEKRNPIKQFKELVTGNRARIAALAAVSSMHRDVLLDPERRARRSVVTTRHNAEEAEHQLENLAKREEEM